MKFLSCINQAKSTNENDECREKRKKNKEKRKGGKKQFNFHFSCHVLTRLSDILHNITNNFFISIKNSYLKL